MRWIGLTGRMGAGKDYAFASLRRATMKDQESPFQRMSFADQLRNEVQEVLATKLPILYTKPYSYEVRRLLQWWGTDLRRAEDPDYWVKRAEVEAVSFQRHYGGWIVFTDVRFPNEADMIRNHDGIIVRVSALDTIRRSRLGVTDLPEHESETAMEFYDVDFNLFSDADGPGYQRDIRKILRLAGNET